MENEKEFFDASAVTDLETARLALRWALEKVHKLTEESGQARQERDKALRRASELSEEAAQKDQTLSRWKETIHVWEATLKDSKKMEEELKEDLRRELSTQRDLRAEEELKQLRLQGDALGREVAAKEAQLGALRRELIDAVQ